MTYLLQGGLVAELSPARLERLDVRLRDGRIAEIAPQLSPADGETVLDVSGKLVMPGFVCAHTHLYSTLSRGMPAPAVVPQNFLQILEHVWWRLDQALDEESLYMSAQIGAIEAIRAGTTTLIDHHASPGFIPGSLEIVARALEDLGLRGILAYEVTDRQGDAERDLGLDEHRAFLSRPASPLLRGMVGGHACFTLGKPSLKKMGELVAEFKVGSHVHVAEDRYDVEDASLWYGMSLAERLMAAGLLNDRSIVAHGVHLDERDLERICETGAMLVHNPRSNMNNAVGYAKLVAASPNVALGTDGIGADMFAEAQAAFFRSQEARLGLGAEGVAAMLANGAKLVSRYFGAPVGVIAPEALADLTILDYRSPTPLTPGNLPWHFVFGMSASAVDTVFVHGQKILEGGRFPALDLERIYARARAATEAMWERMAQVPPLIHQATPAL